MYYTDDLTNGNYILFSNLLIILKHNYHYAVCLISSFLQTSCRWSCSDKCRRTSQSRVTHWYCNTLETRKTNTTMFFKSDYHLRTPRRWFLIDLFNRRLFSRLHFDHRISRKYRQTDTSWNPWTIARWTSKQILRWRKRDRCVDRKLQVIGTRVPAKTTVDDCRVGGLASLVLSRGSTNRCGIVKWSRAWIGWGNVGKAATNVLYLWKESNRQWNHSDEAWILVANRRFRLGGIEGPPCCPGAFLI